MQVYELHILHTATECKPIGVSAIENLYSMIVIEYHDRRV